MSLSDVANDSSIICTEEGEKYQKNSRFCASDSLFFGSPSCSAIFDQASQVEQSTQHYPTSGSISGLASVCLHAPLVTYHFPDREPRTTNDISLAIPPYRIDELLNELDVNTPSK
jgi:hypothetical protein